MQHRKPEPLARFIVGLRHHARQIADTGDVSGALGNRNGAARVEQVERVPGLQDKLVARQRQPRFKQAPGLGFVSVELSEQPVDVRRFQAEFRLLDLVLAKHVVVHKRRSIRCNRPDKVEYVLDALQIHS